jgi:hypothetical protein
MQAPQQPEQQGGELRRNFDIAVHVMTVMAFPAVIITTREGTWGPRYLGVHAVLGFFWPLVFGALYGPDPGLDALVLFWQLSIVFLLVHRVRGTLRRRRGYRCHSLFWGESIFEKPGDETSQKAREKANCLVILLGLCCFAFSKPLGTLLIVAAVCKAITDALTFQALDAQVRQMEDARIESAHCHDLYRRRNPD